MNSIRRKVFVIGVGMTKFEKPGRREKFDYPDMALEAGTKALKDAGLSYDQVQQACVGYCYGDTTCGQRALYQLGMTGIPIYNVRHRSTSFHMSSPLRIVVVGAGAVGLSTAVQIQEAVPSAEMTIIAEKFNRDTTSDGAAGIFRPSKEVIPGVKSDLLKQWMQDSFSFYHKIAHSPEAAEAGISVATVYHFFVDSDKQKDLPYEDVVYDARKCTDRELHMFPNTEKAHYAIRYTTVITECRWYLPWLTKKFQAKGGHLEQKKLRSLEELVGLFDIVVNCTGLGSAELLGDNKVAPNRGQVIRAKAPWVKHSLFVDDEIYIIPGKETVVVGGTMQQGDFELNVRLSDRQKIWENACKYMPSLQGAKWEWEWVGHRPARNPLRLEKENIRFKSGTLSVVHNYGHSGEGVALSWGTGKNACKLVCELVAALTPAVAKL